jgi:hypothetical protein
LKEEYLLTCEMLAVRSGFGLIQEAVVGVDGDDKKCGVTSGETAGKYAPSLATPKKYAQAVAWKSSWFPALV